MCSKQAFKLLSSCPSATAPWLQAGNTVAATISPATGVAESVLVNGPNRQCYYGWPTSPCFGAAQADALACGGPKRTVVIAPGTRRNIMYPFHPTVPSFLDAPPAAVAAEAGNACVDWLAPLGARSVQIAPNVWSVLPNNVPPAVAINAYHHDDYINDIYDHNRTIPSGRRRGCCGRK